MTAAFGAHPRSPCSSNPFTLPWCGTFRTSTGWSAPVRASRSCTARSASPVRTASNPPSATSSTTLASFALAGLAPSPGHSTWTDALPTVNRSPADTGHSRTLDGQVRRIDGTMAALCASTAGYATQRGRTSPRRPGRPPMWSSCACVSSTPSRRRIPNRPSAFRSAAGSGPASTSTESAPLCTKIASPWPTSRTTIRVPATGACQTELHTAAAHTAAAAASATPRLGGRLRRRAAASAATPKSRPAAGGTATDAPGRRANVRAVEHVALARHLATLRQHQPGAVDHPPDTRPPRHTTSIASMIGSTTRFAAGATSDTLPNAPAQTGSVATCAATVVDRAETVERGVRGAASVSHSAIHGPMTKIPATAETESWKPTSNAAIGSAMRIAAAADARAAKGSSRTARSWAPPATESIEQARTAETGHPVTAANVHADARAEATRAFRRLTHIRATARTAPDTTPTCIPETASACDSPADRRSASTSLPARRLLSPSTTPASSAPASPPTRSIARRARARHRYSCPIHPPRQPDASYAHARAYPTIPRLAWA